MPYPKINHAVLDQRSVAFVAIAAKTEQLH